jgi:adenine-specific DNA glycosylase
MEEIKREDLSNLSGHDKEHAAPLPHITDQWGPRVTQVTQADIDKVMQAIRELGETHKRCQDVNSSIFDTYNSAFTSLTEIIQKLDERDQMQDAAIDSLVAANRELLSLVQSLMQRVENLEKPPDNSYRIGDFRPPR